MRLAVASARSLCTRMMALQVSALARASAASTSITALVPLLTLAAMEMAEGERLIVPPLSAPESRHHFLPERWPTLGVERASFRPRLGG